MGEESTRDGRGIVDGAEMDLEALAGRLQGAFGELDREEGRVALAVFRELASGEPAEPEGVARSAGVDPRRVRELLDRWAGVFRDDAGRVVGFWGLALSEMRHRLVVDGRTLYGWCAWDCLFLPELLGVEARVTSRCPSTDTVVSVNVGPHDLRGLEPAGAVVSFVDPERMETEPGRVLTSFCHHVHFFASAEVCGEWATGRGVPSFVLTVARAWRLGRLVNRRRYGELLD